MSGVAAIKPYAQEAEVLRLLLSYGCISGESVITWTDQTIIAETEIDQNLIELSTTPPDKNSDICSKLAEIAVGANKIDALRTALGRMYDAAVKMDTANLAILATGLDHINTEHRHNLPDDLSFLYGIADEFCMAQSGLYGDMPSVCRGFLDDLKRFKDKYSN